SRKLGRRGRLPRISCQPESGEIEDEEFRRAMPADARQIQFALAADGRAVPFVHAGPINVQLPAYQLHPRMASGSEAQVERLAAVEQRGIHAAILVDAR